MYKGEIFLNEIWNAYLAHIETCEQIFIQDKWNFWCFIYGKFSPDIPIKYGILCLPYENGSCDFPTWNLKPSICNIWNLAPQFLCKIWNALHITHSSLCSSFPKYTTEKHVYHIQKPRCQHLTWNLEFCISDTKYLCTNVTTYNVTTYNLQISHMKIRMTILLN